MAEDKKDLKPEEQSGPAVSGNPAPRKEGSPAQEVKTSAPVQEAEKADTPAPADKSRPGNVIDISGAMIDKIVAEKEKAAKAEQEQGSTTDKSKPERTDADKPKEKKQTKQAVRSPKDKAPKKTEKPKAEKMPPTKQKAEKAAPSADGPSRKEQKASWNRSFGRNTGFPRLTNPWSPLLSRKWNRL